MANPTVESAVKTYVQAQYTAAGRTFPYKELDNLTNDDLKQASLTRFYSIDFIPIGSEERKSIGNPGSNAFEETGSFQVLVYVRSNTGSDVAKQEAQIIRDLLRNKSFSGVTIDYVDPPVGDSGSDNGSWYVASVSVDFKYLTFH